MRKLRLELETLAVESFTTATAAKAVGTVKGRDSYEGDNSALFGSCVNTCQAFCVQGTQYQQQCGGGSLVATCAYSCGAANTVCANTCNTCYNTCAGDTCGCSVAGAGATCDLYFTCGSM